MAKRSDDMRSAEAVQPGTAAGAVGETPKQEQARDPYQMGPSNYVPFERYSEANKAASEATAKRIGQQVSGEAQQAQEALQKEYGQFAQGVGAGSQGLEYRGPGGYSPSDAVRQQYLKAQHDLAALGSVEGVKQLLGPKGSMFGAELTYGAGSKRPDRSLGRTGMTGVKRIPGQSEFGALQGRYAGLGGELSAAQKRGAEALSEAQANVAGRQSAQNVSENQQLRELGDWMDYQSYLEGGGGGIDVGGSGGGGGQEGGGTVSMEPMSYEEWRKFKGLPAIETGSYGSESEKEGA